MLINRNIIPSSERPERQIPHIYGTEEEEDSALHLSPVVIFPKTSESFSLSFFQGDNVCKDNKNETQVHPKTVTCNPVAMGEQHLCKLLNGPDKCFGSCLIGRRVSRLLALR